MSVPNEWFNEPPELPTPPTMPSGQQRQFASVLRKMALEGTITDILIDWLYQYEQAFTPPNRRLITQNGGLPEPEGKKGGDSETERSFLTEATGLLKELGAGLKELNAGVKNLGAAFNEGLKNMDVSYSNAQDKMNDGIEKLGTAWDKLTERYGNLADDHRSFLGIMFPHSENMYRTANESMVAYRTGILAEAKAKATEAANAAGTSLDAEAGRSIVGLLTKAAEKKFLGEASEEAPKTLPTKPPEAPKAAPAPPKPEEKKEEAPP